MQRFLGNIGELVRFLITGGLATLGNMTVVWLVRAHFAIAPTIALGLVAGMIISFTLMKFFAFRSREWSGAQGEIFRFLIVYAFGTIVYFAVALLIEHLLTGLDAPSRIAAIGGVFAGGMVMAVTSYLGHRHFTYRLTRRDQTV